LKVELNGTDENPYHRFGQSQNPFPQIARAEYTRDVLRVQSLGGDPIPDADYIREKLKGMSEEFIELCCKMFKKGEIVKFTVFFPEKSDET
jgi:hypothetical protein